MKRIENWENVKENSGFAKLPVGGYVVKILNVKDVPEKEYLKVSFDIAEGDEKGFFKKQYDADTRGSDKKWPNAGSFIRSYKKSAESMFKGFTNAIENSNKGYHWNFEEATLVNKVVGIVVGEEEYLNQKGQLRKRTYVSAVRSVETIKKGDFTVPELKKLDATKASSSQTKQDDFVNPFANDTAVDPFASAPAQDAPVADDTAPWDDSNPFA